MDAGDTWTGKVSVSDGNFCTEHIIMFYRVHRKKKLSSAVVRTTDNAESLATEKDSHGEAVVTVNGHLKTDMATVKEKEEEQGVDDTAVDSTHRQPKAPSSSRRPSYVLTTVPDRRNRLNVDQEEVHDVGTELEQIGESDEDALLGTEDQTHSRASSFRSRLIKMLRQLRSGFIKSFKDLKLFMRWAIELISYIHCTLKHLILCNISHIQ